MSLGRRVALDSEPLTAPAPLLTRLLPAAKPSAPVTPPSEWAAGGAQTRSLFAIAYDLHTQADSGAVERLHPIPTGFDALDQWTGSGLRQGELVLLGGAQGVGKTTLCLQMARNIAASGAANVLYACYEHPPEYILNRLLSQETIDPAAAGPVAGVTLEELQRLILDGRGAAGGGLYDAFIKHPAGARGVAAFDRYAERFHLLDNAARNNRIADIEALIEEHRNHDDQPLALFVDYLQKVEPARGDARDEAEKVTDVVQALKQLALRWNVAVVAIVAADKEGLTAPRLRFTHLRGSSALMYEADIAVIMNDKWSIIDRDHIVFNQHKAQHYRDWVVCTIEKNRGGRNLVEVEFMKRFEYCCFNPRGGKVAERLYDERIQGEA